MGESSEVPPKVRLFQHSSEVPLKLDFFSVAVLWLLRCFYASLFSFLYLCLVIYASLFSSLYLCLMFLREFHRKLVYAVIQKPYNLSILKFY